MDKRPWGSLDDVTGIQNVNDVYRYRNNFYNVLKSVNSGSYFAYPDIQMDQFMGIISNGNRVGTLSNGIFDSGDGDIEAYWANCYSRIASVNFIIPKIEAMIESEQFEGEDLIQLKRYLGEAKFCRAYQYWMLADKFLENYSKVGGNTAAKGLPLVTEYNPTGETDKYPGRSTQDETYVLINKDLDEAYAALKEFEGSEAADAKDNLKPMATYLSSWAVVAMQARVALLKGDYQTAYNKASQVIDSNVYTLTDIDGLEDLWTNDNSKEIIFRPFCSTDELPSSIGNYYLGTDQKSADYIPTQDVLFSVANDDARWDYFFGVLKIEVEGTSYPCYVFTKFSGNPVLQKTSTPNFMHYPKVFRLSEMYLIAAEAGSYCNVEGGSKYLQEFMKNRHIDYDADGQFSQKALLENAIAERSLELIGEGTRLSDLRRWNKEFTRNIDYSNVNPGLNGVIVSLGNVHYAADDRRFVWPIPSTEIENNPQLVGQQNPGY
ncbi:MAG: RagB/SusD family nutrient uptake outer membrane protein [Muribaculaceae bacterium]